MLKFSSVLFLLCSWTLCSTAYAANQYTWTLVPTDQLSTGYWAKVGISGDGSTMLSSGQNRMVHYSNNYGATWTVNTGTSTGDKLYASNYDGSLILAAHRYFKIQNQQTMGLLL